MGMSLQGRFKVTPSASFEFVAAPWPPNERQIKAKIYLEHILGAVIPGHRAAMNPESRDSPMRNCASEVRASARPGMTAV
jgi:hypothetical protein